MNCLNCQAETSNPKFCSRRCSALFNARLHPKRRLKHKCGSCDNETINPKFCCSSCAATVNNKFTPKRKPEHKCKTCENPIPGRKRYCSAECKKNGLEQRGFIGPFTTIETVVASNLGSVHAKIRGHSRRLYKASYPNMECLICGYNKHVEVCHIKSISEFDKTEKISVVNGIDNLVALCPNCHWEFDHGMISMDIVKKARRTL